MQNQGLFVILTYLTYLNGGFPSCHRTRGGIHPQQVSDVSQG